MENIDFIITWVDGNDREWQLNKNKYDENLTDVKMNTESRYRDWDILKYWFRSVEKYAPWVNKIFFVTEGHLPEWLNVDNEKLVVVKHSDFINDKYLPTFNSNVIELSFPNITELSNNFVSFNDDMFLNKEVAPEDFFVNGIPKDSGIFSPILPLSGTIDSIILNNIEIINDNFDKKDVIKQHFRKYFHPSYGKHIIKNIVTLPWDKILGFYDNHIPISYSKKTYRKVLMDNQTIVNKTLHNRFRTRDDINHWLVRYWQLCTGNFIPRSTSFGAYYNLGVQHIEVLEEIKNSKHSIICLNDNDLLDGFEQYQKDLVVEFERKYGEKSGYEK